MTALPLPGLAPPAARAGGRPLRFLVEAYLAWVLFTSTGAVLPLLAMGEGDSLAPEESALLRLTLLPILALVPLVVALHGRAVLAALVRNPLLVALVLLAGLSTAWSIEPGVTARRATAFAAYTLLGVVMAVRWTGRELLERLAWLALGLIAVALLFQLALPRLATMGDGAWRAAFAHKNVLGQTASFALLVLLVVWRHRLLARPLAGVALGLALVLLLGSRSATSLVVTAAAASGFLLLGRGALPPLAKAAVVAFALAGLALLGLWLVLEPERAVELLGRDLTLTGRLPLWEQIAARIGERPWLGWGFHAWFAVPAFADYVRETLGWAAPNAHSGYLEVALGLGLVGLVLALLVLAQALLRAGRALARGEALVGQTALLLLAAHLLRNLVESELLQQTSLSWLLLVTLLVRTGLRPAGR